MPSAVGAISLSLQWVRMLFVAPPRQ